MEKTKNNLLKRVKRSDKPAQSKKKKCEGTCSTFFSDLTRKFKIKKKGKEDTSNIAKSIVENLADTLPLQDKTTGKNLQETIPVNNIQDDDKSTIDSIIPQPSDKATTKISIADPGTKNLTSLFVNPRRTKNNSLLTDVKNIQTSKIIVDSAGFPEHPTEIDPNATEGMKECDIAGELTKHVATLRKISLIADEFNKKTAKNLKEIVDSVSEDLVKKLEEVKAAQAQSPTPEKKIARNQKGITIN